jgi:hypothetical protein
VTKIGMDAKPHALSATSSVARPAAAREMCSGVTR